MNLLITGAWSGAAANADQLEAMGHTVRFLQYEREALPCPYEWVEGVICNGLFQYHPIERFTNLRYIQLTSAGYDRVPMEYVEVHGIEIHNARGIYSIPMAEYAVCGVLQLYKQMPFFYENQRSCRWEKHRGLRELYGKTVCVVGCGSVGTECAKRFAAFGCTVVGAATKAREERYFDRIVPRERLEEALTEADVVVLAVPLSEETFHLMDRKRLSAMKPGAVLVNISRGGVADTAELIEALKGRLSGAVLDVFEEEPLDSGSPLWEMPNVVLTPHNSFVGEGTTQRLWNEIYSNLTR